MNTDKTESNSSSVFICVHLWFQPFLGEVMLQMKEKRTHDLVRPKLPTVIRISSATKSAAVATVNFNQPVGLKGIPAWTTDLSGVTALSAGMATPTQMLLTFSGSIATATKLTIPPNDPSVRNAVGGYVADSSFPV